MNTGDRILVVDDDDGIKGLLNDFLTDLGYSVVTEENPLKALARLKRLKKDSIDLIITDLMMPAMSGMDFIKEIRKRDTDIPVVMITAYPSIDIAVKVMKEGATDFIPKPFDIEHVRLVVRRAIEQGRLIRQNKDLKRKVKEFDEVKSVTKELQKKVSELSALYTISESLQHSYTTDGLFDKVIEVATSIAEAKTCGLWVLDGEGRHIVLEATKGMEHLVGKRLALKESGMIRRALKTGRYVVSSDYKTCLCGKGGNGLRHPFLCIPVLIGEEPFAAIQLCEKLGSSDFSRDDVSLVTNLADKTSLRLENLALYENLIENMLKSITALVRAIDARDNYTMSHCKRVTQYAVRLAECISSSDEVVDSLRFAGPIHDVGKIGIRDSILLKPSPLDHDERVIMESHTLVGDEIVKPLNLGYLERAIVRNHHERFDGTGYPDRLKGEDIPIVSRIFAIVDTYDAMTTDRPYRAALTHQIAVGELKRCSGTQFDGDLVDVFIKNGICKEELEAA